MTTTQHRAAEFIRDRKAQLAEAVVALEFDRHPELEQRYGPIGREKSLQDAGYHLAYLSEALALENRSLFVDYVAWAKIVLTQRRVLPSDLAFHLECTTEVLCRELPDEAGESAAAVRPASTGLGLAIVRRIVEGHGGSVRVESQAGQGSTFSFTLPLLESD